MSLFIQIILRVFLYAFAMASALGLFLSMFVLNEWLREKDNSLLWEWILMELFFGVLFVVFTLGLRNL